MHNSTGESEAGLQIETLQNLVIVLFSGTVGVSHLDECRAALGAALKAYPDGIAFLAVVTREVPVGPAPVREAAVALMRDFSPSQHTAVIIEGEGIASATMRTVANTILLMSRSVRTKIFSDAEEGAQWLVAGLKGQLPPITKVLEILRARHGRVGAAVNEKKSVAAKQDRE